MSKATARTISLYPEDWQLVEAFCIEAGLHTAKGPNYSAAIRAIIRQLKPKTTPKPDPNQLQLFPQEPQ